MHFTLKRLVLLVGLLLVTDQLAGSGQGSKQRLAAPVEPKSDLQTQLATKPKVNAPYFGGSVQYFRNGCPLVRSCDYCDQRG